MTLAAGTKLGPYEIQSPLGAGGMGEVYRAQDTRLKRTVAIKILPSHLSDSPEAKQRFDREARSISSLNHPNICTLHDVGSEAGVDFLVMEFLEGETLADRLRKGSLPPEQVTKYGIEICDGLERAHRSGVVHRDLKPGNIMLTKTGVKLMDFGLAKSLPVKASPSSGLDTTLSNPAGNSPITEKGMVVGTFQYMSPEQVQGKEEVDGRSDIFSLGAVLYEMVTGQRAFEGKSQLSVAAAILEKEPPPVSFVKPMTPPALDHAIRCCLAKDPEDRWQTARDLAIELKWIGEPGSQAVAPALAGLRLPNKTSTRVAWSAALVLALTAIAFAAAFFLRTPKPPQPIRLSAEIGADATLYTNFGPAAILSPNGTRLVFAAAGSDHKQRIYVRSLDQLQATVLAGTENARDPFFSPDGQWLAFFADDKLKKVSIQGGAAAILCDAPNGRGGSWAEDGTIVFAPDMNVALYKVSSEGGRTEPLTTLDKQTGEVTHRWPQVLPGGKAVLFTSSNDGANYEDAEMVVYSMAAGQRKTVQRGGFYVHYLPSGHLVYMHDGRMFAVGFDLKRMEVTSPPAPILDGVVTDPGRGGAQFSFSETGNLVYIGGGSTSRYVSIYWMDHQGKFTPLRETPAAYSNPAFSPDGKRLALEIFDRGSEIWVDDWARDSLTRLTFAEKINSNPVWTPDGQRIVYSAEEKGGTLNLWWKRADGAGNAQRLTQSKNAQYARSWRSDGKVLAFEQLNPGTKMDIMTLNVAGNEKSGWQPGESKPFVNTSFTESAPRSPRTAIGSPISPMNPGMTKCTFVLSPARGARRKFPPAAAASPSGPTTARSFFFVLPTAGSWWPPTSLPPTPSTRISRNSGPPANLPPD